MIAGMMIAAAMAQPSDWYAEPVVSSLQPVRDSFLHRWQDNVTTIMAGSNASPLFRNSATQMDAHWRLAANDINTPWLSEQDQLQAMEQAGLGAVLALQLSVDQIIDRSPEFSAIHRGLRTLSGPSVVIQQQQDGVSFRINDGSKNQHTSMAHISEPETARAGAGSFRQPPSTRLRLSSGFRIVDITRTSSDGEDYTILRPGISLSADADQLGPVSLRLRTALVQERVNQASINWRAAVRVSALPRISLLGDVQGNERLPERLQASVDWRLPVKQTLSTRVVSSYRLEDGEQRVILQLSRPLRWHIPNDIQRWPLGQEINAVGGAPILRRATGPGKLVQLVPPDVARDALALQREQHNTPPVEPTSTDDLVMGEGS